MNLHSIRSVIATNRMLVILALALGVALAATPLWTGIAESSPPAVPEAQAEEETAPSLQIVPAVVELPDSRITDPARKGIWIMAAGLEPGQNVSIMTTMLGVQSDISFMLRQEPVVNEQGSLITSWEVRPRYQDLFADRLTFELQDAETGEVLATAPFAVCDSGAEELVPWCGVAEDLSWLGPVDETAEEEE